VKKVTIEEIARLAGVTAATVSKALNNKPDISLATRERIQKIVKRVGYTVNVAARALANSKTMAIGVAIAFPQIPTVIERLIGIQEAAANNGFQSLVTFHNGFADNELEQIRLLRGRVDGLVLTPANHASSQLKNIQSLDIPIVLMSEPLPGLDTDYVGIDDREGGRLAAVHLLKQNHRRIAYFAETSSTPSDRAIIRGIEDGFSEFGASFEIEQVFWNNLSKESTQANVDRLLGLRVVPTAIFAFSDMTALWVIDRLAFHGVGVPEDMAVVGFDNIEFASLGRVTITSIAQPNYDIGYQAALVLLERINSRNSHSHKRRVIFSPKIVVRESSIKKPPLRQEESIGPSAR
jgi:LacI family transcriptional regulator